MRTVPLQVPFRTQHDMQPCYFRAINHRGNVISIKIKLIDPDNAEELRELAQVMASIFSAREPMTVAVGISEEEMFAEMQHYISYAKKDGLSLILTNEDTGKIIGGIIGRDFYNDEAEDPYAELPNLEKFQPIFDVLDISKKKFLHILEKEGHYLKPGLVVRGTYIGFLSKYLKLTNEEGINIAAYSFRKFEEYGKAIGYKYYYTETTNPGSQKLFRNDGWAIDEIIIPYADYPSFKDIDFHKNALADIGNSVCGIIKRVNDDFPPMPNKLRDGYKKDKLLSIGFPHNLDFNNDHLFEYLNFHINNAGDPQNYATDRLHARDTELAVLNFFSNIYKLPSNDRWGYIASGGTEGNEMGLCLARSKYPDGIVYASEDTHYSIRMGCNWLRMALCEIPSLDNGEINYAVLEEKIKENNLPAIVNVNVGTTMKGAIDNLAKIVSILQSIGKEFYIHCDAALHGGFLPFLSGAPEISFDLPIDSLAISLHKFMGTPFPAATFLSRRHLLDYLPSNVANARYNGDKINTMSCSRNGHAAIFAYSRIIQLGSNQGIGELAEKCIALAKYTEARLNDIGYPYVLRNAFSNIVAISTPPSSICKKWQLPADNTLSHVIIMPHVTKMMIDNFIKDIKSLTKYEPFMVESEQSELAMVV